jgi:uncharacterized protein YuzE
MKSRYDKDVDVLLIEIRDKKPAYGEEIGEGIIIHYDEERNPVEMEILDAKRHLVKWIEEALSIKKEMVVS